jgi:hypothetical protein
LVHRSPWCFRLKASLPYGFVFLKRIKQWSRRLRAHQVLSGILVSDFLTAVSITLGSIFCECGHYRLVNRVHHRLGKLSIMFGWRRFDLYINDDLVGFIKSVPQTRLLDAVRSDSLTHESTSGRTDTLKSP